MRLRYAASSTPSKMDKGEVHETLIEFLKNWEGSMFVKRLMWIMRTLSKNTLWANFLTFDPLFQVLGFSKPMTCIHLF